MPDTTWISPLGAGTLLYLIGAGMHLLIGVLTPPLVGRRYGVRSILFVSVRTDTELYGASPDAILRASETLTQLRHTLLLAIAGLLTGLGIVEIALAWFGVGGGHRWAVIALALSGGAMLPTWWLLFRPYRAAGIRLTLADLPPFIWVPAGTLVPATILSWIGLG